MIRRVTRGLNFLELAPRVRRRPANRLKELLRAHVRRARTSHEDPVLLKLRNPRRRQLSVGADRPGPLRFAPRQ